MIDLHCFPHSGGFAFQFRPLSRALPGVTLRPVEYPSLNNTARPFDDVAGYVRAWLEDLDGVDFSGARLYGHSLGGLLAYEAAVQLESRGTPAAGVVIAAAAPAGHARPSSLDPERCTDEDLLEWSFGTVRDIVPSPADREVFALMAPRLRRDLRTYAAHVPRGSLDRTPALILQGTADRVCPPEVRTYWADRISRPAWEEIEGGHLFHLEEPQRTAAALDNWKAS